MLPMLQQQTRLDMTNFLHMLYSLEIFFIMFTDFFSFFFPQSQNIVVSGI